MAFDNDFLVMHTSELSVKELLDQIEKALKAKKVKVFARINHAQAAHDVGLTLPDEEVLLFGNPLVGTALMVERPAFGIELPLKILAWHDSNLKKTRFAYHRLEKLAAIFQVQASMGTIQKLT